MRAGLWGFLALGTGFAVAVAGRFHLVYSESKVGGTIGLVLLGAVLFSAWMIHRRNIHGVFLTMVGAMTLSLALLYLLGAPALGRFFSTKELCLAALPSITVSEPLLQYRFHHHTARYYARGRIRASPLNTPWELSEYVRERPQQMYLILTKANGWSELERLAGARLSERRGDLYLVRLPGRVDLADDLLGDDENGSDQRLEHKRIQELR
jgi:hypothetical protein